ncbi:MAG: hypothetical protein HFI63_06425 [Lachnospiraceae bacterium]|nr:hypothetical protein [Lachnospiraceae bacterium]
MRKAQKRQAENLVKLLEQAHEEIKRAIERSDILTARTLLGDCQDGAVALGNLIEKTEGPNRTISILEDYCERVYQIHEELVQGREINGNQIYKKLRKFQIEAANSIHNDIRIKREAVFLPYKASMWDSLESVWQAAKADPDCDTYVIPIPYYDKNPDGSLGKFHYEGEEYPPDVPVVPYNTFDFANHRPDMIFIHNPYDEYNYVTTVHPFFYSGNIRRFTDCLVYIPYYETGGEQAENFRTLPVYFTVDYMIAQSKQHMKQFDEEVSEKILILGSPKFDKVINWNLTDQEVPQAWKRKLHHPVFFYNTSITGLLRDSAGTIEKMRAVFERFQTLKATLIWRPHPLFESTIQAMRPDILKRYQETMKYFENLEDGILDQTSEASLGIGLSDAYIGEETSSMVHLFGVLGKPILISDERIREDFTKEAGNARFFDVTEEENFLWLSAGDRNGLIRYEKSSGAVRIFRIPGEKPDGYRLYNAIVPYGDSLYLIPYNGTEIAVFHKKTETFTKLLFQNPTTANFSKAYLYQKKIYMIPARYPAILELNCETGRIAYFDVMRPKSLEDDSGMPFSFNGNMLVGSTLLIALAFDDVVLQVDLTTMEMTYREVMAPGLGKTRGFWCMAGNEKEILLGSNSGKRLLYWNLITSECRTLEPYPEGWRGEEKCFFEMACLKDEVYVFPKTGNQILKISLKSLKIERLSDYEPGDMNVRKNNYYEWASNTLFAKCINDRILFQRAYDFRIGEITESGNIGAFPIDLSETIREKDIAENFYRRGKNLPWAARETKLLTIPRFVQYVQSGIHDQSRQIQEYSAIAENLDGTAGEKIYRSVSGEYGDQ